MDKKKFLFVVHHLTIGGAQKSLINALNEIDYDKFDVTLYVRKNRLALLPQVNRNVKVIVNEDQTKYYRKPLVILYEFLSKLDKKYKTKSADYIREKSMKYEQRTYFTDKEFDTAVTYIQGYDIYFVEKYVQAKRKILFYHSSKDVYRGFEPHPFENLDGIVACSGGVMKELQRIYPEYSKKITYLNNYIDAKEIIEKTDAYSPSVKTKDVIIASCGRISEEKGFDLAVEAADELKKRDIRFEWLFIGGGGEEGNILSLIKEKGLDDYITITGFLDNPYPYINLCDIYVQPSYEDAQPLTVLEAQALGKPVVCTETLGGEYITEGGKRGILTGFSGEKIADGICRLLSDAPLRDRLSKQYSLEDNIKENAVYRKRLNEILSEE